MAGLFEGFRSRIDSRLSELAADSKEDALAEQAERQAEEELAKAAYGATGERTRYRYRRASLVDPTTMPGMGEGGYGIFRPRYSNLSNKSLKEMSLRDPIVAAIFQTRINQVARFSRPQEDRYEPGFRVVPRDPSLEVKPGSVEEAEIGWITDYVRNCGSNEDRDPQSKMDFDTFLRLVLRDRLTFGAAAIETIRNHVGGIHSFLPAPTESIYYANKRLPNEIVAQASATQQGLLAGNADADEIRALMEHEEDRERQRADDEDIEFVQVVQGRVHQSFTRKELIYKLGNPQNFIENNGYCIGELEMATLVITGHLQAENYNRLFFTHGFASRGLIHIEGDVSPSQLQAFRAQWYSQISGNENSWRTPIIAGVDGVEWIPLAANNREMEYSLYIDHIIRTLCSIFAISPVEIGFEHLGRGQGQGGLGGEDNETKIEQSQVRGLKPLLVWLETIVNEDILPNVSEEFASKYKFQFVGLEVESRDQEVQRQQIEIGVRSTINEARRESGLDPILGGDATLNPAYFQLLIQTHKIGEIREFLFGYGGDAENPEFNYVADPLYLQNLELLLMAQQQQMQAEAQAMSADTGEFGDEGQEVDEDGFPIEGDEEGEVPPGEEEEGGFGGGDEGGDEPPPTQKSMRRGRMTLRKVQDQALANYRRQKGVRVSAGLLRKAGKSGWGSDVFRSLAKSDVVTPHQHDKVKVLDGELERARKSYHEAYKRVQGDMVRDILGVMKDAIDDGDTEERS